MRTDFGLSAAELLAVVVALAPELDTKYETIYAYLNDDVTRRAPTIDICVRLGAPAAQFDVDACLIRDDLLEVVPAGYWRSSAVRTSAPLRRFLDGSQVVPRPPGGECHHEVRARLERGLTTVVLVGRAEDGLRLARALGSLRRASVAGGLRRVDPRGPPDRALARRVGVVRPGGARPRRARRDRDAPKRHTPERSTP